MGRQHCVQKRWSALMSVAVVALVVVSMSIRQTIINQNQAVDAHFVFSREGKGDEASHILTPKRGDREVASSRPPQRANPNSECPDWNCLIENGCVSTIDGRCSRATEVLVPNQFRPKPGPNRIVPSGGMGKQELRCSWQKDDPVAPPRLSLDSGGPEPDPAVHWANFQHLTGGYFKNWYPIDAPIVNTTGDGSFRFSAGTQGHDEVYVLKNLCVRPNGRLAGFKPPPRAEIPRFTGETEWGGYRHYKTLHRPAYNRWLIDDLEELQEEPTWFVDQRLAIYPILDQVSLYQHSAHFTFRGLQILHNIAHGIPEPLDRVRAEGEEHWARKDFTTLYLRFDAKNGRNWTDVLHDTGHWKFTTLAARSHMFAYASYKPERALKLWREKTGLGRNFSRSDSSVTEDALLAAFDRPVCFREAVFQQGCASGDCDSPHKDASRDSWMLGGQVKNSRTNQVIARQLRACAAVDTTFVENPTGPPRVLYTQRVRNRGIQHRAYLLGEMIKWLKLSAPGATVRVGEVAGKTVSIPESVAMLAETDITVGTHGGGLTYCFIMPQYSSQLVSVQPHDDILHGRLITIGTDHTPAADFGGMMVALGGHEISVQPEAGGDYRLPRYHMEVSVEKMKRAFYSALCFYFNASQQSDVATTNRLLPLLTNLSLETNCWMHHGAFDRRAGTQAAEDAGGFSFQRSIRSRLTPEVSDSRPPRLIQLLLNAPKLAASFAFVRTGTRAMGSVPTRVGNALVEKGGSPPKKLLVAFSLPVEIGSTTSRSTPLPSAEFLAAVQAELLALRDHVPYLTKIHVIFTSRSRVDLLQHNQVLNNTLRETLHPVCMKIGGQDPLVVDLVQDCVFCSLDQNPDPAKQGGGILCREYFNYQDRIHNAVAHDHQEKVVVPTPPAVVRETVSFGRNVFTTLEKTTVTRDYDLAIVDSRVIETHGALMRKVVKKESERGAEERKTSNPHLVVLDL